MLPRLSLIKEGSTELYVPSDSLTARSPLTHPVFFNPAARTNRDVSVAIASVTRPRSYLDALAGTGARGIRVAKESSKRTQVTLADFSTPSLSVARKNIRKNRLQERCTSVHEEANRYLASRFERQEKFEAIDVDPFGTPAPHVQAAMMASADNGILSLTATDAAVLCGVYPGVSVRRYGALAVRSDFVHETGLRILLGFAARMGGVNDIGIEPVVAHSTLHYLRVFLRIRRGALRADESAGMLGYVTQCNGCGERWSGPFAVQRCPKCNTRVRSAGPLWTGSVADGSLVREAARRCEKDGWRAAAETLGSLKGVDGFPPFSYSPERVCSALKVPSVPAQSAMRALEAAGFTAKRQPFEGIGIKTDAGYEEFVSVLRSMSRTTS